MEPDKDKGKNISAWINEGYNTNSKRDRFEIEGIAKPSGEEENIIAKKARVEGPNDAMQMNKQWPNVVPVSPVLASAVGSNIMSLTGVSVSTSASTSLTSGPAPSSIPPWAPNLASSGSATNTSAVSTGIFVPHRTNVGSGTASSMGRDIPDNLACIGISTGTDMPENLTCVGHGAGTGVGSIFFIGCPEQDYTKSMEDQMEEAENTDGLEEATGVSSAAAVSGSENLSRPGCLQRTINFRDLQRAMEMDPQLAKYGR